MTRPFLLVVARAPLAATVGVGARVSFSLYVLVGFSLWFMIALPSDLFSLCSTPVLILSFECSFAALSPAMMPNKCFHVSSFQFKKKLFTYELWRHTFNGYVMSYECV
eukprot:m.69183 g.69183  ORF g.69183 m.69183 type:complete len:108 (+) comp12030_c0_seq4:1842-2165(+)